nr:prepilin-type N-terminal cleavage/methylation domain-containing protein [Cytobacillus firmus]
MNWKDIKGLTLVEVIVAIAIIGIIAGIALPSIVGIIEKSKVDVCNGNVSEVERHYEAYLKLDSVEHSDVVFVEYLSSYDGGVCPSDGVISYVDERVECSLHSEDIDGGSDNEDGGVPYL